MCFMTGELSKAADQSWRTNLEDKGYEWIRERHEALAQA